nr:exonuclease SbcCD subunit D [Muribaculaceae bacterium]
MKFIHTSDWHFGQELRGYSRLDEHRYFIGQLCRIVRDEQPDALLVSGDVYDTKIPTAAAQRELIDALIKLHHSCPSMAIIVTAGNHDSGARLDAQSPLWQAIGVRMIGSCRRSVADRFDPSELVIEVHGKGIVIAAPYFHQRNYPVAGDNLVPEQRQRAFFTALGDAAESVNAGRGLPVAMMAHLTVDGCDFACHRQSTIGGIKAEKAEEMGAGFDYLALGHIHKPQTLREGPGAIRYSGSPFAMSFSENFPHTVSVVEIAARHDAPLVREVEIEPLRRVVTIEPEDGDFGTALEMARRLGRDDESYVRFVVK